MPIDLWVTHSLDKVFPDRGKPPRAAEAIALKAARNETEDAQIIVRVPRGTELAEAAFTLPDLVGPKGAKIANRVSYAPASLNRNLVFSLYIDEADLDLLRAVFVTGTGPVEGDLALAF